MDKHTILSRKEGSIRFNHHDSDDFTSESTRHRQILQKNIRLQAVNLCLNPQASDLEESSS
jgi:hypothetical protein